MHLLECILILLCVPKPGPCAVTGKRPAGPPFPSSLAFDVLAPPPVQGPTSRAFPPFPTHSPLWCKPLHPQPPPLALAPWLPSWNPLCCWPLCHAGPLAMQVNIDFESEQDMVEKARIGLALQPVATALFANSPFRDGKPTGQPPHVDPYNNNNQQQT